MRRSRIARRRRVFRRRRNSKGHERENIYHLFCRFTHTLAVFLEIRAEQIQAAQGQIGIADVVTDDGCDAPGVAAREDNGQGPHLACDFTADAFDGAGCAIDAPGLNAVFGSRDDRRAFAQDVGRDPGRIGPP